MKEELSIISIEMAELIVKICFLTNDLKHVFGSQTSGDPLREIRCDQQIIYHMDAILAADGLNEFKIKLNALTHITSSFIQIYSASQWSFPEKDNLQNILLKLSVCLKQLQQKTLVSNV